MDTTITIKSKGIANKSDFLHLSYNTGNNKDAIISVDSSNFGQSGSVSWDKSSTLSNIEKVTNWMKQSENERVKSDLKELGKNKESEAKSLILLRCDFNKSVNSQSYYKSPFNRSTSLINYLKDENVILTKKTKVPMTPKMDGKLKSTEETATFFHLKNGVPYSPVSKEGSSTTENKSENTDEVPPSPESRKKELCHYLQLMNPADKKEIIILQNRRSTRVRNLAEQKQVQERMKEINDEYKEKNSESYSDKSTTLKSFKDLNIKINNTEIVNESEKEDVTFSFPFPPQDFINSIKHFDDVMVRLIPKLRRRCSEKKLPLLTKMKPKKHPTSIIRNKTQTVQTVINTPKKNLRKRMKLLRSNGNLKDVSIKKVIDKNEKRLKIVKLLKRSATHLPQMIREKSLSKSESSRCEIISIGHPQDDTALDESMVDYDKLSDEHKKCLMESRILSTTTTGSYLANGSFEDIPMEVFDKNKKQLKKVKLVKKSVTPVPQTFRETSPVKSPSSHCEIISVDHPQDNDMDLDRFIDDMVDFDKLSEEHKKCLIESRVLSTKTTDSHSYNIKMSPLYGFSSSDTYEGRYLCEKYKNSLQSDVQIEASEDKIISNSNYLIVNIHKTDTSENLSGTSEISEQSTASSLQDHDYAIAPSKGSHVSERIDSDTEDLDNVNVQNKPHSGHYLEVHTKNISGNKKFEILPYKTNGTRSLHKSLQFNIKKRINLASSSNLAQEWEMHNTPKLKKQSHFISVNSDNGVVLKAFYVGYNLIICQEFLVSFWMQTPLGNVLGSQNMWVPRGQTQRMVLNNKCLQKDSMEKVVSMDTSVVYIELWMKEHKSEMRQGPVADVFVTLYYWKQRQNGLDKKVLQLENINGFADDVQYCVLKNFPKIIVSWHSANDESAQPRRTFIHAYQIASDYQTLSNIYEFEPVNHYVSSLHNIEGYDDLIMGCGEHKITLWSIEFGNIIATIELNDIKTPLSTLWVKCDRGFLFALQQCVDRELRLIAINGINHSWKKLASYFPPEGFDRLKGVCIENGLLLSFYDQGILCWNAETGEPVEEINVENDIIPSGTHVILVEDNQIIVKHALTHLMSMTVDDS